MGLRVKIFFLLIFLNLTKVQCEIETHFLTLPVDHFDLTDKRTFEIRYLVNEIFLSEDGPILIYINDGPASSQFIEGGNMFEVAEKEGGVLISLERRYYGSSLPTLNASYENLKWLTHHQTVADIAIFASFMREKYFNAPVILWGRSHGASLAIWTRQKYSNIIDGAWGSSPRIDAVLEAIEFIPYGIKMINEIGGTDCGKVISDAFEMIEEHFQSGNTSYIEERLMACGPFNVSNNYDLAIFNYIFAANIPYYVSQMNYGEFEEICSVMMGKDTPENPPSNAIDAFARWFIDIVVKRRNDDCIPNNYETYIKAYQGTSWSDPSTLYWQRQRLWLTCTQHGQFQVANNGQGHPFGTRFDMKFMEQWCIDSFGDFFLDPSWKNNILNFNKFYGGKNPKASRLFITQGEIDPIRTFSPSEDLNSLSPVVIIPRHPFSRDVFAPNKTGDSAELFDTKMKIQQTIHEWIEYERDGEMKENQPNYASINGAKMSLLTFSLLLITRQIKS